MLHTHIKKNKQKIENRLLVDMTAEFYVTEII